MTTTLERQALRFRGDLWNTSRVQRDAIARGIMAERGFRVLSVHGLTSGLWLSVTLENGSIVTITDTEAKRWCWEMSR